jgi:hypothetical protein
VPVGGYDQSSGMGFLPREREDEFRMLFDDSNTSFGNN